MIHIGTCIRKQLETQGKTAEWLAAELGCHPTDIVNIFEHRSIDTGVLQRISSVMHHDFFQLYTEEVEKFIADNKAELD